MADPKLTEARAMADKLREGYLRGNARLAAEVTLEDLYRAGELLRDLAAMVETFSPPQRASLKQPTKDQP